MPRSRPQRISDSASPFRPAFLPWLTALAAIVVLVVGTASAQPVPDHAVLQANLDATEDELDAASEALRELRDAAAQGKRYVVAVGPLDAAWDWDHARPFVLVTREQAIAAVTFAYLFGLGYDDAFDATELAEWVRRYVVEAQAALERVTWLEGRVADLERRRDDLRAELGASDPQRTCIRLVRVAQRIQSVGDARPDPILELDGEVHRYVSPERVGLGVDRYGGIVLEWTPPPAMICEGDHFVLTFSAVNLGPAQRSGGTAGRVQMTREGGVPTFECSSDALAMAAVRRDDHDPVVNVCTFTVASLINAQLDPRAQFTVSTAGTARGAVITYHYAR